MRTILLVDDTAELREVMAFSLSRAGYNVIQAANGMEALRLFKDTPEITAIVTDMEMPMMNGIQLVQEIQSLNSELPIIMWSGAKNPGLKKISFISKPCPAKAVVSMLEALLELQEVA